MVHAYRLDIVGKPNFMYSKSQFEDALNASGLIGKKVAHFYTEFASTDETVQTSNKGYMFICNNTLIIETEDGDWYEFYVAGEGAIAFSKNEYIKTGIYTISGRENDDWVISEVAYDPFKSYWRNKVVDIKISVDQNLAYAPKGFDAPNDAMLPQSIMLVFEDGATLTLLGEHTFMDVEFDTSVPRQRFLSKRLTVLQEKLKNETDESRIKELNTLIQVASTGQFGEVDKDYYRRGLQTHMADFWHVDLYTHTKGYSFLELKNIASFRVSDPVNIANSLLSLALQFIDYAVTGEHHREYHSFSFVSEDNDVPKTHTLYYYFDNGMFEHICVTLDQKKRISNTLIKERKQDRWIPSFFIKDIWCIATRYNLDEISLGKLQDYLRKWENDTDSCSAKDMPSV